MSVLPPIATVQRTSRLVRLVPEPKSGRLLDHLVGDGEQGRRHVEAQRLGSLEIDNQLEFSRLRDWQVGRLFAPENTPGIDTDLAVCIGKSGSIADQSSGCGKFSKWINRRNRMTCRESDYLIALKDKKWIGTDKESVGPISSDRLEGRFQLANRARIRKTRPRSRHLQG